MLDKARVMRIIRAALKEDIGRGDITTDSLVSKIDSAKAGIFANEDCVICGIDIAEWVLSSLDYSVRFKPQVSDGDCVKEGKEVAFIEGHARAILTAERVMLNFLSLLSGISTETRRYVDKVKPYNVRILDTRKTLPLLRYLEKYAVLVGGGHNHRMDLGEMVMVKDNHKKISNVKFLISNLRGKIEKATKIEVEVENLEEFEKVLKQKPDIIMLDNMSAGDVKKAVQIRKDNNLENKIMLEASGGITLDNIEEYAKAGVDAISIGAITDSVRGIDFSLNFMK